MLRYNALKDMIPCGKCVDGCKACDGKGYKLVDKPKFAGHYNIDIEPMGAVRMTGRGKYVKENAIRYLNYKQAVYYLILQQLNGRVEPPPAVRVRVTFNMPIPPSWPEKKKREAVGKVHTSKPDIDNLIKGLFDSVNGLLWNDDRQIGEMLVKKVYAETPGIELVVHSIESEAVVNETTSGKRKTKQGSASGGQRTTRKRL